MSAFIAGRELAVRLWSRLLCWCLMDYPQLLRFNKSAKRAGLADMLTFTAQDAAQRVSEGFLALLTQGTNADDAIKVGRAAAGR